MFEKLFEAVQAKCAEGYIKNEIDNLNAKVGKHISYNKIESKLESAVMHDTETKISKSWSNAIMR